VGSTEQEGNMFYIRGATEEEEERRMGRLCNTQYTMMLIRKTNYLSLERLYQMIKRSGSWYKEENKDSRQTIIKQ
jgi:hypothetical protein